MTRILWQPHADANNSHLARFWQLAERRVGQRFQTYERLHSWSVQQPEQFWSLLWEYAEVRGTIGERRLINDAMPGAEWFPDAQLSFAENLLPLNSDAPALIYRNESGASTRISWQQLRERVGRSAAALQSLGVQPGHIIAAIAPNCPDTIIAMLAATSLGATWSSCSPDFGAQAIIDRFAQLQPSLLLVTAGYSYAGKSFDLRARIDEVRAALPSLQHCLLIEEKATDYNALSLPELAKTHNPVDLFHPRPFATPLYVMFSSGTTGLPKCIVHGVGGTLLQHRKEQLLHCDIRGGERVFFFTTCGWMMWNWLVSALANGATLCLYDGNPMHPDAGVLLRFAEEEHIQHFGISPGYLSGLAKANYFPAKKHQLSDLRSVISTGSPLPADLFHWTYQHFHSAARLSSITGGTDIMGCFALGNPLLPVYAGEIQCKGLGMAMDFVGDDGQSLPVNTAGELVCSSSFPSMPLGFLNDVGDQRYRAAYFERFPGRWHHGDFGEFTEPGGIIIHGRSDATLNRGGVRIGTAEIYRQLEAMPQILESLAVAHESNKGSRIILFVRLPSGSVLDEALQQTIRQRLRKQASPRHVPDLILQASDFPRTRSGKLSELAVRDLLAGRELKNVGALANPESLEFFRELRFSL